MVQAILAGRKTQTRRVIKDKDITNNFDIDVDGSAYAYINPATGDSYPPTAIAKYQVGDILWVRETWRIGAWNEDIGCIAVDYKADNYARREWIRIKDEERFKRYWIESTDDAIKAGVELDENGEYHWEPRQAPTRWRPSIFMPREAARLFLRVKNVRVERLWDITETDVRKEGFSDHFDIETDTFYPCGYFFKHTWNSMYAKRGYGWDTNPWVWVIEFEMINKPQQIHL